MAGLCLQFFLMAAGPSGRWLRRDISATLALIKAFQKERNTEIRDILPAICHWPISRL